MSNFDIRKDKWFFEPKNEIHRDAFLEWAYANGMEWLGSGLATPFLPKDSFIGGNNCAEGKLGYTYGFDGGRGFYIDQGHVEIFPEFKYKFLVDNVPAPVIESPQQKQIRELEATVAQAQRQIQELKKVT